MKRVGAVEQSKGRKDDRGNGGGDQFIFTLSIQAENASIRRIYLFNIFSIFQLP